MIEEKGTTSAITSQQLEQLGADHLRGEFVSKDVEATLATMVEDAYVNQMPVNTSGVAKTSCELSIATISSHLGRKT